MAGPILVHGVLIDDGQRCQGFRSDEGLLISLVGELGSARNGDEVYVIGMPVESAVCQRQQTLAVTWIGKELGAAGAAAGTPVVRDIEVMATYSSHDNSPMLKLEGRSQPLIYDNMQGKWVGRYKAFRVEPPLNVLFVSEGWSGQEFEVKVTATDTTKKKTYSETYKATVEKGSVSINEEMVVS